MWASLLRGLIVAAALAGVATLVSGCDQSGSATGTQDAGLSSALSPANLASALSLPPPVIGGAPAQDLLSVGEPFHFAPSAGGPPGTTLAFMLMNAPAFLSIDEATGVVTGTPTAVDIGSYPNVRVLVTDGVASVAGPAFTLTVVAPGNPGPAVTGAVSISGSPITAAVEGIAWTFRPTATKASANTTLSFRVANAPAWTVFDPATGTLSGTPPAGSTGNAANIVISVSDGTNEAALAAFTLSVGAPQAPVLAGNPGTSVPVGGAYRFAPTAGSVTGPVFYTITGKPAWASFDPLSGTLVGIPSAADAGTQNTITISVSDGVWSKTLPAYTLAVVDPVAGSAIISWSPPTRRVDGAPLSDLAGYRIYYGTTSGSYPNRVSINNPNLKSYVIDALPPGTYHFVTTAFDALGNESPYSQEVSKTIGPPGGPLGQLRSNSRGV